ncbi:GNAT family N-acetyltransferase [Neobacillus kokaensis]|uniref:N-acetyltransferase n=1 Tax=Neobacillus kokaensis TaxID=2759023 RepID=A0ABQ3N9N2_9BACI|nr:GNAT family N-acetyltransferase [Neobacillus kokaensis]GHI00786.1 N-acetyltransferase [Neobacillus kokaensis]
MEIRLLTPTDAQDYWELRLEALKQNPEAFLTSYEEAAKRETPIDQVARNLSTAGNYTFGAFDGQKIIGMGTLLHESSVKIQHKANIFAVYVTPEKQGLGAGTGLLTAAIEKAKTIEAIEKINLTVNASNEKAKKLYTKLGFQTFGYEEKALKINNTYYDEEYMVLHIK